jgi:hypothetical protein
LVLLLHIFAQFVDAGKKRSKPDLKKSVINVLGLLLPVFDRPIIMISPGGLLLVVPTYLNSSPCFGLMDEVAKE